MTPRGEQNEMLKKMDTNNRRFHLRKGKMSSAREKESKESSSKILESLLGKTEKPALEEETSFIFNGMWHMPTYWKVSTTLAQTARWSVGSARTCAGSSEPCPSMEMFSFPFVFEEGWRSKRKHFRGPLSFVFCSKDFGLTLRQTKLPKMVGKKT